MAGSGSKLYTTNEILEQYPCGRTKLYSVLSNGSLKSLKWGRKYLIREEDLNAFLEDDEHTINNH